MARLPLVSDDTDHPVVRPIFDAVMERGARVGLARVPAIYRTLANAPGVLEAWTALAWPLRSRSESPRALRELMALRVALVAETPYLWHHHRAAALASGVRTSQIRELHRWEESGEFDATERAALRFTDELVPGAAVSDDTFAALAGEFPPAQIVELTVVASFLACAARVIRALDVDVSPELLSDDFPG